MIEKAAVYYRNLGISVIPVNESKVPRVPKTVDPSHSWAPFQSRLFTDQELHMFKGAAGLAAVGGAVSGNLFCIDLDKKFDVSGICEDFLAYVVSEHPTAIIQKTPSGGYHVIFRVDGEVPGNKKIAGRYATEEEFQAFNAEAIAYNKQLEANWAQGIDVEKKARKLKNKREEIEIHPIETRGNHGYFLLNPSPNYNIVNGDITNIPKLSKDDFEELMAVAASYDETVKEEARVHIPANNLDDWIVTPFDSYNAQVNMRQLLESHGWEFRYDRGHVDFYRRPGSKNKQSANYNHKLGWFTVFSSQTEFQQQKAYKPCYVYALLEHGGDFKAAAKALLTQGYGQTKQREIKPTYKPHELIADYKHIWEYNRRIDRKEIQMGLKTGWPELDLYFRFKQGNFVIINGHPTVGKTVITVYLALISAMRHDWSWVIATTENDAEWIGRMIMEMYINKQRSRCTEQEIMQAEAWVEEHFTILRASEFDFEYKDLIDFGVEYYNTTKKFTGFLIDPYSALHKPENIKNEHQYNYRAASAFRRMAKDLNVAVWLTCHSNSEAQRKEDKHGYAIAPKRAECEGGALFANRADDFLTVHRVADHQENWMITQIHVRKMKVQETGGQQTKKDKPFLARYVSDGKSCIGFVDDINKNNPLYFNYTCYQDPFENR